MKYILTGGGTGGHIFSAIATANEIKKQQADAEIIFVGSKDYMEMDIVPKAGYKIIGMNIHRMNRFGWWKNYKQPFEIISSLIQSWKLINHFKPDAVIGTGGFATGPILKVAQWKNIPTFIQEHNAYPGITTRLLAKKATRIHTAYKNIENYIDKRNILLTGNPVRQDINDTQINQNEARQTYELQPNTKTLVIIGGSRGAEPVNKIIVELLPELKKNGIQVLLQTGKKLFEPYKNIQDKSIKIVPFLDNIPMAIAAADVIISRSGAMSIAELSLVGKPIILIPDTYSEQQHQDYNAESLANETAAIYIKEVAMPEKLLKAILAIFEDENLSKQLSENISKFAFPNATHDIVADIISELT